jgi:hypothetical protein
MLIASLIRLIASLIEAPTPMCGGGYMLIASLIRLIASLIR